MKSSMVVVLLAQTLLAAACTSGSGGTDVGSADHGSQKPSPPQKTGISHGVEGSTDSASKRDSVRHAPSPTKPKLSCDLDPAAIQSNVTLPSLVGGADVSGFIRSSYKFEPIEVDGTKGIMVHETMIAGFYDSVRDRFTQQVTDAMIAQMKSAETCQISVVGGGGQPADEYPLAVHVYGDFKLRKCGGTDVPCGETCEISWGYQACRTKMCRIEVITDAFSARVEGTSVVDVKVVDNETIQASSRILDYKADASVGDLANALGLTQGRIGSLFGVSLPDLTKFANMSNLIKVPQAAFLWKPTIADAKWVDVTQLNVSGAQRYGLGIEREQPLERTVGCKWINCLREGSVDACQF
ncbi:hypothetical protein SCB29_33795 [Paraburkholderia sp. SIMBA_055]